MIEKNILAYTILLSLNISDFSLFLCKTATPLKNVYHPCSQQPRLKIEILPSHF